MPSVGSAIVVRLEGEQAWLDVIGRRLDWTVSQPGTPFPRCVGNLITRDRPDHYDGEDMQFTRFQLDVYSDKSAEEASAIAEIAIPILRKEDTAGGVRFCRAVEIDGPTDSGEQQETIYVYRARTDFAFLHTDEGV